MANKTKQFELLGALVGHPDFPGAKRGDVLKLEVGDDNLPTSDLLRSRVRPLGESLETGEEMTEKEAKGKAKEIIDKAKEEAQKILDKANTDAAALLDAAGKQ
jgi:hypothetical protein